MKWPDRDQPPACSRLHAWLNRQDTLQNQSSTTQTAAHNQWLERVSDSLQTAKSPLIWLESCDVDTARWAVRLAQKCRATLHVAQSPGESLVSAVTSSIGWLGTSLGEMRHAATLIVHVGQQHLHDMPLLMARFAPTACEHIFLSECPAEWLQDELASPEQQVIQLQWNRSDWLDGVMRTLLAIRDESIVGQRPAEPLDPSAALLAERLLANRYSVIVWGQDELTDSADRMLLERLVELADGVGQVTRCTLLPLASDSGRVTSQETVLWLTNRTTPVRYNHGRWTPDDFSAGLSLDQWQSQYDYRLCIRSLPADVPLPELAFQALIDAECNQPPAAILSAQRCYVRAIGLNASGHLTRGDHGLAAYVPRIDEDQSQGALAWEVLSQLEARIRPTNSPAAMSGKETQ